MKVLFICSYRAYIESGIAPFIEEQASALRGKGIEVSFFVVRGKGIRGYLQSLPELKQEISDNSPDVIHAHYGLCGLLANLQLHVPVVTTYHGSDINVKSIRLFSIISILLSKWNIFVSSELSVKTKVKRKYSVIPCGVVTTEFTPKNRTDCRNILGLKLMKKYVLFSKMFEDPVKNYPLARSAVNRLENVELLEFTGYSREEVPILVNAVDCVILTSFSEGSPQIIKEALACGTPVVSVRVGDVPFLIEGVDHSYLCDYDAEQIADCLKKAIDFDGKTSGPKQIVSLSLEQDSVISKIIEVYERVVVK